MAVLSQIERHAQTSRARFCFAKTKQIFFLFKDPTMTSGSTRASLSLIIGMMFCGAIAVRAIYWTTEIGSDFFQLCIQWHKFISPVGQHNTQLSEYIGTVENSLPVNTTAGFINDNQHDILCPLILRNKLQPRL